MSKVTILKSGTVIREIPLSAHMIIGRHPNSDIQLEDDQVSRTHAEVWETDGAYFLKDRGSTNGTYRNAVRLG